MAFVVPDRGRLSRGTPIGRLARLLKPGRASPDPTKLGGNRCPVIALATSFWHYHRAFTRQHSATRAFFAMLILSLESCAFFRGPRLKKPPAHPININAANSS